jgi:hypothetical protein
MPSLEQLAGLGMSVTMASMELQDPWVSRDIHRSVSDQVQMTAVALTPFDENA